MKDTLKKSWQELLANEPNLRIRDAAVRLGSSEAELLALKLGEGVQRLKPEFNEILKDAASLGRVMALTRNNNCVHERKGVYNDARFSGPMGLVVTPDIDLRLMMNNWAYGFSVNENGRKSLQFFNKHGEAVHKIFLTAESDAAAYDALVAKYLAEDQQFNEELEKAPAPKAELPDNEIDVAGFQEKWMTLKDTHDFFNIMRKHKIQRLQAMRLAPEGYTRRLPNESVAEIIQKAADAKMQIMVFTGSKGCIQIHTGTVEKLLQTGPWFNVLDEAFSMHLRTDGIDSVWVVKKPTVDGMVHSIEAYDKDGGLIVQLFGKRKPGIPELQEWQELVAPMLEAAEVA